MKPTELPKGHSQLEVKATLRHRDQVNDTVSVTFDAEPTMKAVGRTAGNKSHKYVTAYDGSETEEHRTKAGLMKVADVPWESRNKRSVWNVATAPYKEAHFATYPPDLIKPCIMAGTKPGDVVLDPFGGSGTTGQVALELGRKATLIELNPDYAKIIDQRTAITPGLALD